MAKKLLVLLCISFILITCKNNQMKKLPTVDYVNIERFMGDWYVIAIIPNFIEKNAVNGIESYKLLDNNKIKIDYRFRLNNANGKKKHLQPKAEIYNKKTNAEWRVQFIWPLKFPYLIIELAKDYSYTVIGVPNRKLIWIMAREPSLDKETYRAIIKRLDKLGYNTSVIKKMPQVWNENTSY